MIKRLQPIFYFLLLAAGTDPLWAGTEIKAHLQSDSYKDAVVDVETSIDSGRLKMSFKGPWAHGSLIYDRDSSEVMVVDNLRKTVLTLTQDNQSALKLVGAIASARMAGLATGGEPFAHKIYILVQENVRAFFNGVPVLKNSGVQKEGFTCNQYRTDLDGKKVREVWSTTADQAGISGEDYDTLRSMAHLVVDLCGSELAQMGADTTTFEQDLSQPQLPVLATLYSRGKPSGRFEITEIHSQTFGLEVFAPPAGYQILSLLDLMRQGIH